MSRRLSITIRLVVITAIVAGLWWFIHAMDFAELGKALRSAKVWPLVVAACLSFVCLWGKALCWRLMLEPRHKVPVSRLFRYTIATFAASAIAPARAGEVLRVWVLKRRDGVPAADSAAVAVAEKLLDGISLVILVAPVPFLLPGLPSWVASSIAGCAAIAIIAFVVLYIAAGPGDTTTSRTWLRRFLSGMHVLRSPKRLMVSLGVLLLVWAADLGEVMLVLYAVDIDLPIAAGLLILFALNLTIAVPSTPGQVGALEIGALAALGVLHVSHEAGLAFALLYHTAQIAPLIVAGLALEFRLVLGREEERAAPPVIAMASSRVIVPTTTDPAAINVTQTPP